MTADDYTAEELEAGETLFRRPCRFLKSVPSLEFLPEPDRPEIAFAGRSNVGKSSLINALANQGGLARTSNTPGRTQDLNFFAPADGTFFMVDMPGYGFAEAPKAKVEQWTRLVKDYLRGRQTLARVFLLIDSRHGLKAADREVMVLMDEAAVSYQGVLTKADKLKPTELVGVEGATAAELAKHAAAYPVLLATSSQTGTGIGELRAEIARIARAMSAAG